MVASIRKNMVQQEVGQEVLHNLDQEHMQKNICQRQNL